jgi:hypothetical protein
MLAKTVWPSLASALAVRFPIPVEAPVIRIVDMKTRLLCCSA